MPAPPHLRVAIDTGGTFTDCVYLPAGQFKVLKLFSTPADPSQAVLNALAQIAATETLDPHTPIEAFEYAYPFRVRRYAYREGSGGAGQHCGGNGLVRELELLAGVQVTLLADRRKFPPYSLEGSQPGACGRASFTTSDDSTPKELPGKCSLHLTKGAILRIETHGGGGWGMPS
jgi:N-methylhydantoinase B